uniref:SP-RING-type domain-containing protein n=1 Tax=Rhabditophanes sp. KR3021 TaxID=114890 RepID=A0AC35UEX1_9BILA
MEIEAYHNAMREFGYPTCYEYVREKKEQVAEKLQNDINDIFEPEEDHRADPDRQRNGKSRCMAQLKSTTTSELEKVLNSVDDVGSVHQIVRHASCDLPDFINKQGKRNSVLGEGHISIHTLVDGDVMMAKDAFPSDGAYTDMSCDCRESEITEEEKEIILQISPKVCHKCKNVLHSKPKEKEITECDSESTPEEGSTTNFADENIPN